MTVKLVLAQILLSVIIMRVYSEAGRFLVSLNIT